MGRLEESNLLYNYEWYKTVFFKHPVYKNGKHSHPFPLIDYITDPLWKYLYGAGTWRVEGLQLMESPRLVFLPNTLKHNETNKPFVSEVCVILAGGPISLMTLV